MDENKTIKHLTKGIQTQPIDNYYNSRPPLFSKTYFHNHIIKKPLVNSIKNSIIQNEEENSKNNLEKSISLLRLFTNKSILFESKNDKIIPVIHKKGKTCSFRVKNDLYPLKKKKESYNFSNNRNNHFYLTTSLNNLKKKKELKIFKSVNDISKIKKNDCKIDKDNMIDLIHDKEINVCLDLIKSIDINTRNKENGFKTIDNYSQETNDLIKIIKKFNIDNIANQRIIENQIIQYKNMKPEFNPLNTMSLSMSTTNYKTNNSKINNIINNNITLYKSNINHYKNNSKDPFISLVNSNESTININDDNMNSNIFNIINKKSSTTVNKINESSIMNNNSSFNINDKISKKKMIKSFSHNLNKISSKSLGKQFGHNKKGEINFQTGFVNSQQKTYDDPYTKFFNNKRNKIKFEEFKKRKKEKNAISLPEIEEYKNIIKQIKTHKNRGINKSRSVHDFNQDSNEFVAKDRLIEELNNMFLNQKNIFLNNLKENYGENVKKPIDIYKENVNKNIKEINKFKRKINLYVDGYSLLDSTINKKINQYNYILGDKFHDKKEKEKKEKLFNLISDEYEKNIKNNKEELFNAKKKYDQYFVQKLQFNNEKKPQIDKLNLRMHKFEVVKDKHTIGLHEDIKNNNNGNNENNLNNNDKMYNEFISFKNEYKNHDY